MLIFLKNKDTLVVDDFKFKCSIGKNGISKNKVEGDKCTPQGIFELGPLYFRKDKNYKPKTNIKTKIIKKNMGWCDDPKNKLYNKEIIIDKFIKHEKLFRKDSIYDYLLVVKYNTNKSIAFNGSAIFIHLTNNYKPTAGCIALKKKDFLIMIKLINKKVKIKIN
ncbi:L,D-transpeptidase family protein [Candidatus Pelagibacter sp.]|nr:L,D-transpeptidase family protein [Candidatus Pelagibacter sp.]